MTHTDRTNAQPRSLDWLHREVSALHDRVGQGATAWLAERGIDATSLDRQGADSATWNLACYLALRAEDMELTRSAFHEAAAYLAGSRVAD